MSPEASGEGGRSLTRAQVDRALELASRASRRREREEDGYSPEQVVEAAREAGLDPDLARWAVALRHPGGPGGPAGRDDEDGAARWLSGAPLRHRVSTRIADPGELDDPARTARRLEAVGGVLDETRGRTGVRRIDGERGRLRWESGSTRVTVEREADGWRWSSRTDLLGHYLAVLGGSAALTLLVVGLAGGVGGLATALGIPGAALLLAGTPWAVARGLWPRWARTLLRRADGAAVEALARSGPVLGAGSGSARRLQEPESPGSDASGPAGTTR